ncbi:MAG: WbqC family protein [Flavobacteriales bacterium]|nr:WbqC family protein [Flavobacteriales bacterium]
MKMKSSAFPFFLFPNIGWWKEAFKCNEIIVETSENWVKQSLRNRYELVNSNGRLRLSVPIIKKTRGLLREVEISYTENWPLQHWRGLEAAYNKSPYFEFYKSELQEIIFSEPSKLIELNTRALKFCVKKLNFTAEIVYSQGFVERYELDLRHSNFAVETVKYSQVFNDKLPFESNLSVLDLLFNYGSEAASLLR